MNRRLRLLIATALAGGLLTAGCAQASPETDVTPSPTGDAKPSVEPLPVPTAAPSTASSPRGGSKDEVVLSGTVEMVGVEGGCRALRTTDNKRYELQGGDANVLRVGAQVTVRGKIRTDLMTICQIGPVLEVISSQPA